VLGKVVEYVRKEYKAGVPTHMSTTMGPVISQAAFHRVTSYIESAKQEGARLVCGGKPPEGIEGIEGGYFIEPTIFADVKPDMRIAREEIFGPVMSVFKWSDEAEMVRQVNDTEYGLTAAVYTKDIATAQSIVKQVEAGFVWVNQVGRHFLGVPFGGYKESGGGREEALDEMLSFTQVSCVVSIRTSRTLIIYRQKASTSA
jgi:betaine-aldehyde dehydrogenase